MERRFDWQKNLPRIFWVMALIAVAAWTLVPGYTIGWDSHVYVEAIHSLKAGHDPYLDATTRQRVYHALPVSQRPDAIPYSYVYSPMTLPLLRIAAMLPLTLVGFLYWTLLAVCLLAAIWVCLQAVTDSERNIFFLLAPVAMFFPGLLQYDGLFNGNVAYVLYGFVLVAALIGWKRDHWLLFYVAVVFASCFKAPLLSLLAIPVLSARKQWLATVCAAVVGVGLFAIQPLLWPSLFQHYLEAVELQFSFNRDFSCSPAGVVSDLLFNVVPYRITSAVVYALGSLIIAGLLLVLSRRFLAGYLTWKQWMPVMLVGVILLNPRIMEYDVAPITVAMALVAWRFFEQWGSRAITITGMVIMMAVVNVGAAAHLFANYNTWKPTECVLLIAIFAAGVWTLFRESAAATRVVV